MESTTLAQIRVPGRSGLPKPSWLAEPAKNDSALAPPEHWRAALALVDQHVPFHRRILQPGDRVQTAGTPFHALHLIRLGGVKTIVFTSADNQQVAGLHLKGDWLGFDGMATGRYACDGVAMDTSEIWSLRYSVLFEIGERVPELVQAVHTAMARQLAQEREWRVARATLSANARLADFLHSWAQALAQRGLRTDHITLQLSRAEIGDYLGMKPETVSRAFQRLVTLGLVVFDDRGRRSFAVPDIAALALHVRGPGSCLLSPTHPDRHP
ncbi:MAG: Crp/Fnr family transcriptional regulator [Burkholderiaceae bacterium]